MSASELPARLKAIRLGQGRVLEDVSRGLDLSTSALSRLERDERGARLHFVDAWAQVLHHHVEPLLYRPLHVGDTLGERDRVLLQRLASVLPHMGCLRKRALGLEIGLVRSHALNRASET